MVLQPNNDVVNFAYGRLDLSVSSAMFCDHRKSIQLPFPDERMASRVMSDQYFILDHLWAPEGTLPVWCEEIQYTAWPPVSAVHPSSHRSASLTPYFTDSSAAETSPKAHFLVSKTRITDNIHSLFLAAQHQCILALPSTLNIMTVHLENRKKSWYCCYFSALHNLLQRDSKTKIKGEKSLGRKSKAQQRWNCLWKGASSIRGDLVKQPCSVPAWFGSGYFFGWVQIKHSPFTNKIILSSHKYCPRKYSDSGSPTGFYLLLTK